MIFIYSIVGILMGMLLGFVAVVISWIGKVLPCIVFCIGNLLAVGALLVLLAEIDFLSLPMEFEIIYTLAVAGLATYYFHRKTLVWFWHKNKPAIYILENFNPMPTKNLQRY